MRRPLAMMVAFSFFAQPTTYFFLYLMKKLLQDENRDLDFEDGSQVLIDVAVFLGVKWYIAKTLFYCNGGSKFPP